MIVIISNKLFPSLEFEHQLAQNKINHISLIAHQKPKKIKVE